MNAATRFAGEAGWIPGDSQTVQPSVRETSGYAVASGTDLLWKEVRLTPEKFRLIVERLIIDRLVSNDMNFRSKPFTDGSVLDHIPRTHGLDHCVNSDRFAFIGIQSRLAAVPPLVWDPYTTQAVGGGQCSVYGLGYVPGQHHNQPFACSMEGCILLLGSLERCLTDSRGGFASAPLTTGERSPFDISTRFG